MPIVTLPIAEWTPDLFPIGSPGAATITNVVPRTPTTYGPMPTPTVYSGALSARCIGSYTIRDTGKNVFVFAADAAKLYLLKAGSTNFADVSGATYTGAPWPDTQWEFTSFGLRVVACNYNDATQTYLVGTDTVFSALGPTVVTTGDTHTNTTLDNLATTTNVYAGMSVSGGTFPAGTIVSAVTSGTAVTTSQAATGTASGVAITFASSVPRAKFCEAVGDFVMLANTFDGTSGAQPQRVWWSGIGNPMHWPLPGSTPAIQVQSDYQDLQQTDLGQIMGIAAGPLPTANVTIFCEHGVWTALYVGSPTIFSFKVVDGAPGCVSPQSIIKGYINSGGTIVPVIYYRGANGFYAFNGTTSTPIGTNRFDRFVISELDAQLNRTVLGGSDPANKLIFWLYSTAASTGLYDRMLVYNWDVNRASYVDLTNAKVEWVTETATIGYTLEELDAFGTLDTLPYSLDSEAWVGGTPRLGVFDSSHRLAYLTGSNMAVTVETPEVEPVPGKRVFVRNTRPLVDAAGGSTAIGGRERTADSVTLKTAVLMNAMGECPQRYTGRYVKARFTFPAATNFTHISGIEADVIQVGIR